MPKALIAGAGIAGLAAAAALTRAGWACTIVERAEALGEVGAGLQMSPNAARVLDWLGVVSEVRARGFSPKAAVLRDGQTGDEIYCATLGGMAERRWHAPYLHIHRADLHDILLKACRDAGVEIRLGTGAEQAVNHAEGIRLKLANGDVLDGDLVLGANGIRSALRKAIAPDEAPRFTGQIAWRGLVPADRLPKDLVPADATVWAGPGQHLVTYYLRGGSLVNVVAVIEQDEWTEEGWSAPGDPVRLRAAYEGWHPTVTKLLDAMEDCFIWGLFDRPAEVRWVRGRLALIGDAAHPMLPFMAQGAAQALEDAAALARHLKKSDDIPAALEDWEEERWSRVTRVQETARANGGLFHRQPGLPRLVERNVIGTVSPIAPGLAAGRLDWLYGYDAVRGPR